MKKPLQYDRVNKIFNEGSKHAVHALRDVSFAINAGELFCLLGPSGCGKTTILRCTAGLESLTNGHILYGDQDITSIPPYRRNIGMVFQSFALYPHMNVFENVAYGLRVRKLDDKEVKRKVNQIIELVGLADVLKRNPSPTALSGGQQQRVAIARALVYDPDVLLLDEPLANLDAKLRRYMRAEIRRIQKATNITTIFVTHDQEEAMAVGDRLAVLRDGIVEQIGTSNELYHNPCNAFVANFIGKMNFFYAQILACDSHWVKATLYDGTLLSIPRKNYREPIHPIRGDRILIAARPEHLSISTEASSSPSIAGQVSIIQHLGHIVRYEVDVAPEFSDQPLEIDMDSLVESVREKDNIRIVFDQQKIAVYGSDGSR